MVPFSYEEPMKIYGVVFTRTYISVRAFKSTSRRLIAEARSFYTIMTVIAFFQYDAAWVLVKPECYDRIWMIVFLEQVWGLQHFPL